MGLGPRCPLCANSGHSVSNGPVKLDKLLFLGKALGLPNNREGIASMNRNLFVLLFVFSFAAACAHIEPPVATTPHTATAADYPEESIKLRETGVTRLRYLIGTDGTVKAVEILESSGHLRLDGASAAMVIERWRFEPAKRNDQAIETWESTRIVWRLAGRSN